MARYFDLHPENPQPRAISQIVEMLRNDAVIAYPTDSCYALGARMDNHSGTDRIREIRHLRSDHHFTLVCADFAQLGHFVHVTNSAFRAVKAATLGSTRSSFPPRRKYRVGWHTPRRRPSECVSPATR